MSAGFLRIVSRTGIGIMLLVGTSLGQKPAAVTVTVHIDLKVLRWPDGTGGPTARNIALSAAGQQLAVSVISLDKAEKQTRKSATLDTERPHLLLLLPAAGKHWQDTPQALLKDEAREQISWAFGQGWLVRVVDGDGPATMYVGDMKALTSALSAGGTERVDPAIALNDLIAMPGARALVLGRGLAQSDPQLLEKATGQIEDVFVVNGGIPGQETLSPSLPLPCSQIFGGEIGRVNRAVVRCEQRNNEMSAERLLSPSIHSKVFRDGFEAGVWHGRSLAEALKQARHESRRHFEIAADVPRDALKQPLRLGLRKVHGRLDASVAGYVVEERNGRPTRVALPDPLFVRE